MNSLDSITLKAFLQALAEQDAPLPDAVQQSLYQMAQRLTHQQAETLASLRALVETNPSLEEPYSSAYREWQRRYQAQERAKSLSLPANGVADFELERFVLQVLNSEDPTTTAKQVMRHLDGQSAKKTTKKSVFWDRSDRVMVMASGGAALGAMVGQVPGAVIGAVLAAIYGWYSGAESSSGKGN